MTDARGRPLAIITAPGNHNERRYLEALLDLLPPRITATFKDRKPTTELYADRGYDSEARRTDATRRGLTPHISRRRHRTAKTDPPAPKPPPTNHPDPEAGKRWPIERTNSWLLAWRRLLTRYERRPDLYQALAHLAATVVLIRSDLHGGY